MTSSDENGLIIVWTLYKNMWYEEMINNRNKSIVKDMKWNYDGQKICIIYEDGAIIVGSVDGGRLWNKDVELQLKSVEWSPDGSHLLLVSHSNEICIYDMKGNLITSSIITIDHPDVRFSNIICITWKNQNKNKNQNKEMESDIKSILTLYITFDNGVVILWDGSSSGNNDDCQVLVNTEKKTSLCSWSYRGDIVALCSQMQLQAHNNSSADIKLPNIVHFYSSSGILLQVIKLPGGNLSGIAWEQSGLRLAATVDSHVYFIHVRPRYNFTYLASTVVYALRYDRYSYLASMYSNSNSNNHFIIVFVVEEEKKEGCLTISM